MWKSYVQLGHGFRLTSACTGTRLNKLINYTTKKYMYMYDLRMCSLCFVSSADWRKTSVHLFLTCVCVCVCVWFCVPKADTMQVNRGCSVFFFSAWQIRAGRTLYWLPKSYHHCYSLSSSHHRLLSLSDTRRTTQRWHSLERSVGPAFVGQAEKETPYFCYLVLYCL